MKKKVYYKLNRYKVAKVEVETVEQEQSVKILNRETDRFAKSEDTYYRAFINLYNILKQNKRVLLDETISQLQTLKVKVNCGNNVIVEIDEELAALGKQNSLYTQMLANGVIDEITYHEKADKIKGKIEELRSRRLR